ncbi:hypothetical protein HHK36_030392 [Tetracentron sinense]|uniref:DUF4283 domain-containing protein n=1 Tax=Tetracentron sinense TaxID=13715 RepID=A0A835CYN9_TETSI|nr:hypothetical protein HHK36_030392 [Tetracentron sinense]
MTSIFIATMRKLVIVVAQDYVDILQHLPKASMATMGGRSPPRPPDLPKVSYAEAVGNALRSRLGHHKDFSFDSIKDVKQSVTFQGEPALFYTAEELKISAAVFQKVLIAKFAYGRSSIEVLKNYIQGSFHTKLLISVGILDEKHLLIRFESEEDFIFVWLKEFCYIEGQLVRFIKWTPLFQAEREKKSGIGSVKKKPKGMETEGLNKEKKRGDTYTDPNAKESTTRWVEKTYGSSKQHEPKELDKQTVLLNTAVAGKDEEGKHSNWEGEKSNCNPTDLILISESCKKVQSTEDIIQLGVFIEGDNQELEMHEISKSTEEQAGMEIEDTQSEKREMEEEEGCQEDFLDSDVGQYQQYQPYGDVKAFNKMEPALELSLISICQDKLLGMGGMGKKNKAHMKKGPSTEFTRESGVLQGGEEDRVFDENGVVQTEIPLLKDPNSFTFKGGWTFLRKIYFNADECVMPPRGGYPRPPECKVSDGLANCLILFPVFYHVYYSSKHLHCMSERED